MNRRPTHYECAALPAELHQRMSARWAYPHPADECSLWSLEARIGAVVRCLIGGLRSRRSTKRGGSCWRCDRTARINTGLTAWQRIVCGCIDDGGSRRSRVDRISVCTCFISRFSIRFAVRRRVLLRNDRDGRCGGDEGSEVHHIFLCIGRHAGNNERAVDAILLPEILEGIHLVRNLAGNYLIPAGTEGWDSILYNGLCILDGCRRHSTGDFLQSTYTSFRCLFSFNSLYKNGFSGLIWPLLPAEHPRCFAAQELSAAIASWQKTLSRMYLCFLKSPVVSPGPDSGLAVCKGLDEARASERWKMREAGVSSSCSGEESGVRTHGAFYTQRFSGPPPSSTRPPLRICPYAWPVIWSFQLWCSQYRK